VSRSTTLPFPSSPHWVPITTTFLPIETELLKPEYSSHKNGIGHGNTRNHRDKIMDPVLVSANPQDAGPPIMHAHYPVFSVCFRGEKWVSQNPISTPNPRPPTGHPGGAAPGCSPWPTH